MPARVESSQKSHLAWLDVRLERLQSNLKLLKAAAGPETAVMAVIKANAYGHGLIEIARALAGQVAYLGVSSLYEALELKEHGIDAPVFLFGRLFGAEMLTAVKNRFTLSVSSPEEAREISGMSAPLLRRTAVHVKIDTGMGRLGIPLRDAVNALAEIASLPGLELEGIYTHFPTAEKDDGFREEQVRRFEELLRTLVARGLSFRYRHAANSAACFRVKSPLFNMVRPGLLLYGISPEGISAEGFRPILSFKTRVILVKRMEAGESVGYGRDFTASKPANVGVIPVGYSHGYPYQLAKRGSVLYRGRRYPLAGRVSMDYACVNFRDAHVQAGDEITLLGEDGTDAITARDLASWAGTIPYEITTRLSPRLPRFYQP